MKLTPPANENYAATVVRVRAINTLDNCDNVVGVPVFGYQAITQKGIEVDDLRVFFPAEAQLSEEYARLNNLHRHGDLNADPGVAGYLEDNRRVKALKFRKQRSDALLMPLSSVGYAVDISQLKEGDTFDRLGDHEICKKYQIKTRAGVREANANLRGSRVEDIHLPKHYDTANYFRNKDLIFDYDFVVVTQKLHGSSVRVGRVPVKRKLSLLERIAKRFGVRVVERDSDYVFGSRNVIKDPNDPDLPNFYTEDIYTQEGKKLEGLLPDGYILFGELVGYVEGLTPIQSNYTYGASSGERQLFIYRVAHVNTDGYLTDLSWDQVKEFCNGLGLRTVPELWRGLHKDFDAEKFLDVRLFEDYYQAVVVSDLSTVDEGVCVRKEGLRPLILKAKSPVFLAHETKMLDKEVVDLEEEA